jgi:hypothetical protein
MDLTDVKAGTYNSAYVLRAEAEEIKAQCLARGAEVNLQFEKEAVNWPMTPDRLGLALSGGGIRSACIAAGILQGMAKARMLNQVHYISAISGGGYALAWLTAWIDRQKSLKAVEDRMAHNTASGVPATEATPPGYARHVEPFPLHYLRRYTSYLAPRSGLLSGDTLAMVSIYLRNVLLNQAMLACVAIALMLILQAPAFLNSVNGLGGIFVAGWIFFVVVAMFGVAFLFGIGVTAQSLHRLSNKHEEEWYFAWHAAVACGVAACTFLWLLLPRWYATYASLRLTLISAGVISLLGAVVTLYYNRSGGQSATSVERRKAVKGTAYVVAWVVVGFIGFLVHLSVRAWLITGNYVAVPRSYGVFGLAALLLAMSLMSYAWVGIVGNSLPDGKREWLARAAGYFLASAVLVALAWGIAFYGPVGIHLMSTGWRIASWKKWAVGLVLPGGWLFTVVAGLLGASSNKTDGRGAKKSGLETFVGFAPPVFLLGVMMLASWGSGRLVTRMVFGCTTDSPCVQRYLPWADWAPEKDQPAKLKWEMSGAQRYEKAKEPEQAAAPWLPGWSVRCWYVLLLLVFGLVALMLASRLDVNEFSLHLFYRNRLVRAFLGASRPENKEPDGEDPRKPSPFTGFAPDDDIFLKDLTCAQGFQGPYPIWGTCLNLTTGEDLAWQQRKGASFVYSPLFCGWDYVNRFAIPKFPEQPLVDLDDGRKDRSKDALSAYGYRSTRPSTDNPADKDHIPGYGGDGGSPLIGTAMAASGAAISPNWGYHSKPGIAALLALFNLRLGWWAGNPRHPDTWKEYAPPISYLAAEMLGEADDRGKYVYLSDGGHFENLGLYELVRRRVRFIICSDADADPQFAFGDLGNAIDHCRRDFGVEINVHAQKNIAAGKLEGFREAHYALGTIVYPGQKAEGLLLYIKSSLTSDEPGDVLGMKAQDKDFPHDTTLNQFFNESMFESYRALGQHMFEFVMESSHKPGTDAMGNAIAVDDSFFQRGNGPHAGDGDSRGPDDQPPSPVVAPGPGDGVRKLFAWLVEQRDKREKPKNDPTDKLVEAIVNAAASFKPASSGGGAEAPAAHL